MRPLFAQLGAIERSDGSAQVSHGRTAALAAVFGPGDVRAAKVGGCSQGIYVDILKPGRALPVHKCL